MRRLLRGGVIGLWHLAAATVTQIDADMAIQVQVADGAVLNIGVKIERLGIMQIGIRDRDFTGGPVGGQPAPLG